MATLIQTITTSPTNGTTQTFDDDFDIQVTGSFYGSIHLERSFDAGVSYSLVTSFMSNPSGVSGVVRAASSALYRFRTDTSFSGKANVLCKNKV